MQNAVECFDAEGAAQQAINNFTALLEDTDFAVEMELMGIGRLHFMLRRRMLVEWRGLYAALWRLALSHSFPGDADRIFATFLQTMHGMYQDAQTLQSLVRAKEYWAMLAPVDSADFSPAARHLASFFNQDAMQLRSMNLKLALHIRTVYKFIFDRLF
ncbi:MAG: conserved hypothetical protein [Candidatus Desulfovibrio kirbyi]|uniref:Uncharacterized protein n=1 Tax=Candidatus Desulfovibrio kirbyi TaxID=2696086 RepID=A0A6L2R6P9_9BACT|nr:MAG: conserved hypothetical protein [Candidatus Desulfovibrio kirbyi]